MAAREGTRKELETWADFRHRFDKTCCTAKKREESRIFVVSINNQVEGASY